MDSPENLLRAFEHALLKMKRELSSEAFDQVARIFLKEVPYECIRQKYSNSDSAQLDCVQDSLSAISENQFQIDHGVESLIEMESQSQSRDREFLALLAKIQENFSGNPLAAIREILEYAVRISEGQKSSLEIGKKQAEASDKLLQNMVQVLKTLEQSAQSTREALELHAQNTRKVLDQSTQEQSARLQKGFDATEGKLSALQSTQGEVQKSVGILQSCLEEKISKEWNAALQSLERLLEKQVQGDGIGTIKETVAQTYTEVKQLSEISAEVPRIPLVLQEIEKRLAVLGEMDGQIREIDRLAHEIRESVASPQEESGKAKADDVGGTNLSMMAVRMTDVMKQLQEHALGLEKLETSLAPEIEYLRKEWRKIGPHFASIKEDWEQVQETFQQMRSQWESNLKNLNQSRQEIREAFENSNSQTSGISSRLTELVKGLQNQAMEIEKIHTGFLGELEYLRKEMQKTTPGIRIRSESAEMGDQGRNLQEAVSGELRSTQMQMKSEIRKEVESLLRSTVSEIKEYIDRRMEDMAKNIANAARPLGQIQEIIVTLNRMEFQQGVRDPLRAGTVQERKVKGFCPHCRKEATAPASFQGKRVMCAYCKQEFNFPYAE